MSKTMKKNWGKKLEKALQENDNNELLVKRIFQWRNLQALDKTLDKKKQKVLWPLYNEDRDSP